MRLNKKNILVLALAGVLLSRCDDRDTNSQPITVTPAEIIINGKKIDTAYLHTYYNDRGAYVLHSRSGTKTCNGFFLHAEVSGSVNTALPGIYFLNYNGNDSVGNPLAMVTRTVHVVENSAGFLNGNYNVACSCTAVIAGSATTSVTADNYTASVTSGSENNSFELSMLRIGPEYVKPSSSLKGYAISMWYFNTDYHPNSSVSGTLSPTKNTFTIESKTFPYSPLMTYKCNNIYSKQLIEIARNDK